MNKGGRERGRNGGSEESEEMSEEVRTGGREESEEKSEEVRKVKK